MTPDGTVTPESSTADGPISPLVFLVALLRRRWLMLWLVLGSVVGITAYTLIVGRRYSSTLIFMPQTSSSGLSGIAGVAAQFGIAVASGTPDQTPQFYAELMATGPFEEDLVSTQFPVVVGVKAGGNGDSVVTQSLVDWLAVDKGSPEGVRRAKAATKLGHILTSVPDVQTSMLTVTVTTKFPDLSKEIADRVLALVNEFNGTRRSTDAGIERRFVEGRVEVARDSLTVAEDRVRHFLEQNRTYASSPMLQLEHDRLQREVDFQQQVVATLLQGVEQARINEVRNTPVVTVVEAPEAPAMPDRSRLLLKWVLATMAAFLVGLLITVLAVVMQLEERHEPDVSLAYRSAWADTRNDILRVVGPLQGAWRRIRGGER